MEHSDRIEKIFLNIPLDTDCQEIYVESLCLDDLVSLKKYLSVDNAYKSKYLKDFDKMCDRFIMSKIQECRSEKINNLLWKEMED